MSHSKKKKIKKNSTNFNHMLEFGHSFWVWYKNDQLHLAGEKKISYIFVSFVNQVHGNQRKFKLKTALNN